MHGHALSEPLINYTVAIAKRYGNSHKDSFASAKQWYLLLGSNNIVLNECSEQVHREASGKKRSNASHVRTTCDLHLDDSLTGVTAGILTATPLSFSAFPFRLSLACPVAHERIPQ